jgi:predicted dehydrogenase
MDQIKICVIGCGAISPIYLQNLTKYAQTTVAAVADLDIERAKAKATEYGIAKALTVDEILADPEIEIILNLTIPVAHNEIARKCLEAGKHVYNEKPLTVSRQEAIDLLNLATEKGLRVGCAPDTVLGAGIQTVREIVDRGELGEIVGIQGWMMGPGVETWHPNPPFYYQKGGGPLFDMGPYYLSAMLQLCGPIAKVTGFTRTTFPTRFITSEPLNGQTVTVETPTHIVTALQFENGAIGQLTTSFDTMAPSKLPCIEIYGSEATIRVPDPNTFGGPILISKKGTWEFEEVAITRPYAENSRGLGVLDMGLAIRSGRPHRANGQFAAHALDVMHAAHESAEVGSHIQPVISTERPLAMPTTELVD